MPDLVRIGPFPVKLPTLNSRLGRKCWDGGSLVAEQHAMARAAMSGRCSVCGIPRTAVRPRGAKWAGSFAALSCKCRTRGGGLALSIPYQLPPHGPEHPVDVMIIQVPRHGGRKRDGHDNRRAEVKAIVDEIAYQLWPKGPDGKPIGKVDDSAPWLRWTYGSRRHRKARKRPRPGDPPADPSNKDTELCEIWIAPREDCGAGETWRIIEQLLARHVEICRHHRQPLGRPAKAAAAWLAKNHDGQGATLALRPLLEHASSGAPVCGCGRSMLPMRVEGL